MTAVTDTVGCKGCAIRARLKPEDERRIVMDFLRAHPQPLVSERAYRRRLEQADNTFRFGFHGTNSE